MKKASLQLETLACPACVLKIEAALRACAGVDKDSVKVMFNACKAKCDFDEAVTDLEALQKAVTAQGYEVLKARAQ